MKRIRLFKNIPILMAGLVIANTGLGFSDDEIYKYRAIEVVGDVSKVEASVVLYPKTDIDSVDSCEGLCETQFTANGEKFFVGGNHKYRAADEATLIECMDNDTLWGKEYGKRPVILLKDAKPRTSVVLDLKGYLCFIGDAGTAKRVVEAKDESWRKKPCDKVENYKENNKELREEEKEEKIKIIKERKTRFLLRDIFGAYIDWEDSLIQAILSDNVNDLVKLSSESSFDPNEKIGSLRISPIEFMALCGSVKCFKHANSTNLYKFDNNIAEYAILGGNMDIIQNMEIIHILEQKGISFNHVLSFTRDPDLAEWLLEHWENTVNDVVSVCKDPKRWSWAPHLLKRLSEEYKVNFNSRASNVCFAACTHGSFFS